MSAVEESQPPFNPRTPPGGQPSGPGTPERSRTGTGSVLSPPGWAGHLLRGDLSGRLTAQRRQVAREPALSTCAQETPRGRSPDVCSLELSRPRERAAQAARLGECGDHGSGMPDDARSRHRGRHVS